MLRNCDHSCRAAGSEYALDWATDEKISWVNSIDQRFNEGSHSYLGSSGLNPTDISQGNIGNCWSIAGASSVAEKPERLKKVFLNDEISNNGIYGFQFYVLGVPTTVVVDDQLPLSKKYFSVFAGVGVDGALWGPLYEKAFAKLHGTYEDLVGGDASYAINVLTGAPHKKYKHTDIAKDALFDLVKAANDADAMISAGTQVGQSDKKVSANGLAQSHAYTVLGAFVVNDAKGVPRKLYKIRNPWGEEKYKGPYSDSDSDPANWDQALQQAVAFENKNDGTFFMDETTYFTEFVETVISTDTTDLTHSYFLIQDDSSTAGCDGKSNSANCVGHKFTVKSVEAQKLYISMNTWDSRTYPTSCLYNPETKSWADWGGPENAYHYYQIRSKKSDGSYTVLKDWKYYKFSTEIDPIDVAAGAELEITMNMDW